MRRICAAFAIMCLAGGGSVSADMLGNPGAQVGQKNLFVGIEYATITQTYDLDTSDLGISSERANLKVTTGLTDWLDVFAKVGGASLRLDYQQNDYQTNGLGNAVKNYDSDMNVGVGGGARLRLLNYIDSGFRIFIQGGGYFYTTDGEITWQRDAVTTFTKEREIKWAEMYGGIGAAKRMDYIDLTFGVGVSQVRWWIEDVDVTRVGSAESRLTRPKRDSWESGNPVFGFFGLDFVLPHAYRLSAQAQIRTMDDAEFSVAISQGLDRE